MLDITRCRGTLDTHGVANRKQRRSKYGAKKAVNKLCQEEEVLRKEKLLPDPKYKDVILLRFMNNFMKDGKKSDS